MGIAAISNMTWIIFIHFPSHFLRMLHIKFGSDPPSRFREDDYGNIHVSSPGAGADKTLGTKFFHKHKSSVHLPTPIKFSPLLITFTNFPFQMHWQPKLTLPQNTSMSSQGHDSYIYCGSLVPHAKRLSFKILGLWLQEEIA